MDTLYPIIRRARRPLLVHDTPPVVAGNVEPVKVEAAAPIVQPPATRADPAAQNPVPNYEDTPY